MKAAKHKKIVRQRILTAFFTLIVLTAATVGLFYGISYLRPFAEEKWNEYMTARAAKASENRIKEEAAEEDDGWYIAEKEELEVDYADVPEPVEEEETEETVNTDPEIESHIANMTLEQKIAQLFIITPEALTGVNEATAAGEATRNALSERPVGGIIYFAPNIVDPEQTSEMLSNMQSYAMEIEGVPLLICVDEETGRVSRLSANEAFEIDPLPTMQEIGESGDIDKAYSTGMEIGMYLHEYGFNVDFAPVADTLFSPENSVIGDRSFGSDPDTVSKMSWQFAEGLRSQGIVPCFKHFPGHGSTSGDSHTSAVILEKTAEELKTSDLIPFENAVTSGAFMIMAGHISCPQITGDNTPASLSSVMINDLLRKEMGYNGLVVTDALNMGAVADNYSPGEAAKMAVNAGVDLLLTPADYTEAYQALLDAVKNQEIEEERINDSLRRILRIKLQKTEN